MNLEFRATQVNAEFVLSAYAYIAASGAMDSTAVPLCFHRIFLPHEGSAFSCGLSAGDTAITDRSVCSEDGRCCRARKPAFP